MRKIAFAVLLFPVLAGAGPQHLSPQTEKKIDSIIGRMTLAEKLDALGGTGFGSKALPRLGIPAIEMIDGPQGVRGPRATAFPGALANVATWNPELMRKVGAAIGREVRAAGKNMILGPCVTLYRVPLSGRNYECYGEDPVLNAAMAEAYVTGTQDSGVMSSTKHFLLNSQEINRKGIDMHIDERALHELELPAFHAAIDAGTESVMSSYNLVDGMHASESRFLHDILKVDFGFKGFIVSDWESTYNGLNAAKSGLDLEMPYGTNMNGDLKAAVESGELPLSLIDDKLRRQLRALFASGNMDRNAVADPAGLNTKENRAVALRAAQESIVLLKNDGGILPLAADRVRSIAILGPNAAYLRYQGGGSGRVSPLVQTTVLAALRKQAGVKINYARGTRSDEQIELISTMQADTEGGLVDGFQAEYFGNSDLKGAPLIKTREPNIQVWNTVTPDARLKFDAYSARWTGTLRMKTTGPVWFDFGVTGKRYRFTLDGQVVTDRLYVEDGWESTADVGELKAGDHKVVIEYRNTADNFHFSFGWLPPAPQMAEAIEAAKNSDVAIVVVGTSSKFEYEDADRPSLELPGEQAKLIDEVLKVNPRTIVVVNSGGPVAMRAWRDRVPAIVQAWFPGQEGGTAIAQILLGKINPSGKLPITMPRQLSDSPSAHYYHGQDDKINFSRVGVFEGYRGYDKDGVEPEFPFGHGLSYTKFQYARPRLSVTSDDSKNPRVTVTARITNTGAKAGAEVVQVYVEALNPRVARPPRELKAFRKISLAPGEAREIVFTLDSSAFRYWDSKKHDWTVDSGDFVIHVGASSRDLRLSSQIRLKNAEGK